MPNNEAVLGQHLNGSQGNNFNALPSYSFFSPPKESFVIQVYFQSFLQSGQHFIHVCVEYIVPSVFRRLTRVEMETISLIAEAEVNVITLHSDLKEPFSSGSLMNNLAFDVSQLPFSQEGACVEKHMENHSFKNDFKQHNLCTVQVRHILDLFFFKGATQF